MRNKTISKRVKLAVILCAAALCSHFALLSNGAGIAWGQAANRLEFVGFGTPMEKRTGTDDGAVLAVHFMGDTQGGLDTCG